MNNNNIIPITSLVIVFILIILLILKKYNLNNNNKENLIVGGRQTIWTYWQGPKSPMVEICFKSWKKHLPDWEIMILNENTIWNYINKSEVPKNYDNLDSVQRKKDVIALILLKKYGGVWMDASILVIDDSLNNWFKDMMIKYDTVIYETPQYESGIEMWFVISKSKSYFIEQWSKIFNMELEKYIDKGKINLKQSYIKKQIQIMIIYLIIK